MVERLDSQERWLEYVSLDELVPADVNPKDHDDSVIDGLIDRFGLFDVVAVVDERTGRMIAGHGRRERILAKRAGGESPPDGVMVDEDGRWLVPTYRGWRSSSDAEANAAAAGHNQATIAGGWDGAALAEFVQQLQMDEPGLVELLGFPEDDLAALLAEPEPAGGSDPGGDRVPESAPAKTGRGDVWLLGAHRVMCGDCRDADDVAQALAGATINVAVTSPPYADRREYDEDSGFRPIPPDEYVDWFEAVQANVAAHLAGDGSWFVNIKAGVTPDGLDTEPYVLDLVLAHVRRWGWHWATEFCWERGGVPKRVIRRFKNQFEPVYQFARGDWKMRPEAVQHRSDNVPVAGGPGVGDTNWANSQGGNGPMFGARKRKRGYTGPMMNVQGTSSEPGEYVVEGMAYPGNRLPTFAGSHEATGHTAAYPVGLPEFFIKAYSDEGDVIFDPFLGSGSTLIAAHGQGRVAIGMEISPRYVDIICRRFQEHTGVAPVLEATGESHDFTAGADEPE